LLYRDLLPGDTGRGEAKPRLNVLKSLKPLRNLAQSRHAGKAAKAVRILNTLGTIRGALTTVVLATTALTGAFTVQTVRSDMAADRSAAPTATPAPASRAPVLDAASLRIDSERRLLDVLRNDEAALDGLRAITVLSPAAFDALIAEAKTRLHARYDMGIVQIEELAPLWSGPPPWTSALTPSPRPSPSVIALNAIVTVAAADMNQIVVATTRVATAAPTAPPPSPRKTTPPPTPAPTPTRSPAPTPTRTAVPSPTKTPTPHP
jgi:hypothetical protein